LVGLLGVVVVFVVVLEVVLVYDVGMMRDSGGSVVGGRVDDPFESLVVSSSGVVEFVRLRVLEAASRRLEVQLREASHPWLRSLLVMKVNEVDREIVHTSFLLDPVDF
jgi:uncharacterized membrane protein